MSEYLHTRRAKIAILVVIALLIFAAVQPRLVSDNAHTTSTKSTRTSSHLTASSIWSTYEGVEFRWGVLEDSTNITDGSLPPSISFPQIHADGWNLIRVIINWGQYEKNPSQYVSYLQDVATYADQYSLNVIYTPYGTNGLPSSWGTITGFPSYLTSQYSTPSDFWNAWLANTVTYQGTKGWDLQNQFEQAVINAVDSHPSTLAYEIMNEPDTPNNQYSQLSQYQTYIASQMRSLTQKAILFMGPYKGGPIIGTSPSIQSAVTGVSNTVFDGHDYTGSGSEISTYAQIASTLGVPLIIGEWSVCSAYVSCPTTQSGVQSASTTYESLFTQYGAASCYWAWTYDPTNSSKYYQNLLDGNGNQWWLDNILVQT